MSERYEADLEHQQPERTGTDNNPVVSFILFTLMFLLFAGGLYVMSLYPQNHSLFLVGLGMDLLALFITFTVIPKLLT